MTDEVEKRIARLEVEYLERIARLEAECLLWRENVAILRDVACNYAPAIQHCQAMERVRDMMAKPAVLKAMVDERLAEV